MPGDLVVLVSVEGARIGNLPNCRLLAIATPIPCSLNCVPARLVHPVIISAAKNKMLFHPDDLSADREPCRDEAIADCSGMKPTMPNVCNIAGEKRPHFTPIGTVVILNRS